LSSNRLRSTLLSAAASGLADVAGDSPYQQWLVRLLRSITPDPFEKPQTFTLAELPEALVADGSEWAPAHLMHCPLRGPGAIALGGLILLLVAASYLRFAPRFWRSSREEEAKRPQVLAPPPGAVR